MQKWAEGKQTGMRGKARAAHIFAEAQRGQVQEGEEEVHCSPTRSATKPRRAPLPTRCASGGGAAPALKWAMPGLTPFSGNEGGFRRESLCWPVWANIKNLFCHASKILVQPAGLLSYLPHYHTNPKTAEI